MTTAPAYVSAGTSNNGASSTSVVLAVPATSVLTGLLDIASIYIEDSGAVTPPDGTWSEAPDSPLIGSNHVERIFYRRPTGSETGTVTFTHASAWSSGVITRYSGVKTTGTPFDITVGAISNVGDGVTPNLSDTTTVANTLLVWVGMGYNGGDCSTVSGFTERVDSVIGDNGATSIDTKTQATATAIGPFTATFTLTGPTTAWLGALLPIPDAAPTGMSSFWAGSSAGSSTSATGYQFLSSSRQVNWSTTERTTDGSGGRALAITEDVEIVGLFFTVDTAPGASKSWTVTFRDDQADTAAVAVISGAGVTSGSWAGSVLVAAGSLVNLKIVPSGTPTASGIMRWYVTYRTGGNYYLMMSGNATGQGQNATGYTSPCGGVDSATVTSIASREQTIPQNATITKIALTSMDRNGPGVTGGTQTLTAQLRKNNTTDSDAATLSGTTSSVVSSITSFAVAAGDSVATKLVTSQFSNSIRCGVCYTVVPDVNGETAVMFGHQQALSTSATQYEGPAGIGAAAWSTTEADVTMRFPAGVLKKLYVALTTATGASKTRAFTVRSNSADTTLVATITNAAAGNDTTHFPHHNDGDLISFKSVPTSTPAASAAKVGFVVVLDAVGTIAATMAKAVASIAGSESIPGTLGATMQKVTASITGSEIITGVLGVTMQKAVIALTGAETIPAQLAATMKKATFAGTGQELITGVLAATLAKALFSGSGASTAPGALAATLKPLVASLEGLVYTPPPLPVATKVRFATAKLLRDPMIVSATQVVTVRTRDGVQVDQVLSRDQINLTWSRELRETSRCELAGQSFMSVNGNVPDIYPYEHWIDVWDDTGRDLLWTGPITEFKGNDEQLMISALDVSVYATKTRVPLTKRWQATDPAEIAGEFYAHMVEHHNLNVKPIVRRDPLGDRYDFTSKADDGQMDKTLEDLVGLGMVWTVVNGVPILGPWTREVQAPISQKDFIGGSGLTISRSGANLFNDVLLRSGDQKTYAKIKLGTHALQQTVDIDSIFGVSNTDRAAAGYVAYTGTFRDMVTLTDGSVLRNDAPVSIEQLIPGARFTLSAYNQIYLMQLTRVEVTTSAGNVQVSVAMEGVDDELPELVELQTKRYGGGAAQQ